MGIKTSAKFDKNVRDAKDAIVDFYNNHEVEVQTGVSLLMTGAAIFVWARIIHDVGYNNGYAQGAIDVMKIGLEQGWFKNEFLTK